MLPTASIASLPGVPRQYDPDETVNYEVGIKSSVLDHVLSFEASIYYIDWTDLQVVITTPSGLSFFTNAGKAKSEGIELSAEARPMQGLRLAAWVAYNNAKLTEDFPAALRALNLVGGKGDRIPDSVEWSGHFSVDQEFMLPYSATGYVGGAVSYVGDRRGPYVQVSSPRQLYPHYTQVDLHACVRKDSWTVNLFANNVTDKRSVLTGDPVLTSGVVFTQPRTIGLSVERAF